MAEINYFKSMTKDKWEDIKEMIKNKFTIESEKKYPLENVYDGEAEELIFRSSLGRIKLEFITKPKLLDKKTNYSRRIGSDVKVEYIYSKEEKVNIFKAYKWDTETDDWVEINSQAIDNF